MSYEVHAKAYGTGSRCAVARVRTWHADPRVAGREVGGVTQETTVYHRPVRRLAVRTPTQQGRWAVGILVSSLTPEAVLTLTGQSPELITDPLAVLLAYVAFYDQRGGGIETTFREDKHGLGLTKRAKRRLPAQELLVGLSTLAHNVLVWARRWLCPAAPRLAQVGLLRLVRDVLHISGFVDCDATTGRPVQVTLNGAAPGAGGIARALHHLLTPEQISVTVGVT